MLIIHNVLGKKTCCSPRMNFIFKMFSAVLAAEPACRETHTQRLQINVFDTKEYLKTLRQYM